MRELLNFLDHTVFNFILLFFPVFCFLAYVGVSSAVTLMVPYTHLSETAAVVDAFQQRGLKFMSTIIGIGACLGLIGISL